MVSFSKAGILTLVVPAIAHGASVSKHWTLHAKEIAPDGFKRSASLVNGVFPGPLLKACKGDTITVEVHNKLADPTMRRSTSIHWHGLFQPRNAYNDGPSFVTQCPIAPNHSYTYKLVIGDQAGTFWYHSHLSTQYADGIRGPIVIYDPDDPHKCLYDVDDENTVITLADWYHLPAPGLAKAWFSEGGPEPVPDSGLINGVGRYSGGPTSVRRSRINVEHGKRYRFRLISLSALSFFNVSIVNHSMTVIEADGVAHHPYTVKSVPILPGQRYSVVVTANQPVNNYWISATQTIIGRSTSAINPHFNGTDTYAVLHYAGAPKAEPTAPQPAGPPTDGVFQEHKLRPLMDPGAPGGCSPPDQVFNFTYFPKNPNFDAWFINNHQYKPPTVPTLLNILANGFRNNSQFGPSENTFVLKPNSTIEVSFIGGPFHAFHLHGHTFDVIQSASGSGPNYHNPPRRDVVASGGTTDNPVRIRFRTENPGPWFVHCHINWHLEAGLAAVFVEDPSGIAKGPKSVKPNAAWKQLCDIYDKLDPSLQ